jgi:hypothetical protein
VPDVDTRTHQPKSHPGRSASARPGTRAGECINEAEQGAKPGTLCENAVLGSPKLATRAGRCSARFDGPDGPKWANGARTFAAMRTLKSGCPFEEVSRMRRLTRGKAGRFGWRVTMHPLDPSDPKQKRKRIHYELMFLVFGVTRILLVGLAACRSTGTCAYDISTAFYLRDTLRGESCVDI